MKYLIYVIYAIWLPFGILGMGLYYTAKILRAIGFFLTLNMKSAKSEITDWSLMVDLGDLF